MTIEIRIYKQFDTDLLALCDAGYPIRKMLKQAVTSYANGVPCHFYIDDLIPFNPENRQTIHARFDVPESDGNTIYMLKHIHRRYRNTFCKIVLRNAIIQQNVSAFFTDPALYQLQNVNIQSKGFYSFQNIIPLSTLREEKSVQLDGKKYVRDTGTPVSAPRPEKNKTTKSMISNTPPINTAFALSTANPKAAKQQVPVFNMPQAVSAQVPFIPQPDSMSLQMHQIDQNGNADISLSSSFPDSGFQSIVGSEQPHIDEQKSTIDPDPTSGQNTSDDEELMKIFDNL